jgi:phosphate transport system substrate-binding protein
MSREMKNSEIEEFEKKHGFKPTKIGVALDSLAVFVNKDNPIKSLSLDKVDAIFSKTHKRGGADATTWGQLGVTGKLAAMPISLYGRNSIRHLRLLQRARPEQRRLQKQCEGTAGIRFRC